MPTQASRLEGLASPVAAGLETMEDCGETMENRGEPMGTHGNHMGELYCMATWHPRHLHQAFL